jgi:hypothetical protein
MLNGFGSDYDNLLWATSGDGTFDNLNILTPVYTPGTNDILAGNVELSLTALALSPCAVSSTDVMILSFDYPVIISDLVTDQDLNAGDELQLTFLAQSQTVGVYAWYHNNVLIIGENASVLSIQNITLSDAGYYYSVYSTDCGEVTSGTALISIFEAASMQLSLDSGWAGISTYVQPVPSEVSTVFGAIVNDVDIISNQYLSPPEIFWPLEGINTLGNWSATKGYKIKMINQAELTVTGKILYPSAPLSIQSGWSYLPVNSVCPVNVAEIFDSQPSVTMIKEIAGWRIYWPVQGVNTLQHLMPGKAYEILNSGGSFIQIQYPGCEGSKLIPDINSGEMKIQSPWNEIHHSSSTHVFGFTSQASADFEQGDIIGAFDQNDLNVGIIEVISSEEPMAIAAFSDDDMTIGKDGLVVGETVTFKIYRPSTQEVFELTAIYAENSPVAGNFAVNGISVIEKAEFKTTSIGFIGSSDKVTLSVYPNPATSVINVSISSNNTINGTMMLMNANGQIVIKQQFAHNEAITRQQLDVSSVTKGVYYLKVVSDNILKVEKILIN